MTAESVRVPDERLDRIEDFVRGLRIEDGTVEQPPGEGRDRLVADLAALVADLRDARADNQRLREALSIAADLLVGEGSRRIPFSHGSRSAPLMRAGNGKASDRPAVTGPLASEAAALTGSRTRSQRARYRRVLSCVIPATTSCV